MFGIIQDRNEPTCNFEDDIGARSAGDCNEFIL